MDTQTPVEVRKLDESLWELMQHDHFTPKELGRLVGIEPAMICEAVFHGELQASVLNHHVVSISREDAIVWLRLRQPR
jgi:hypothetical protein